MIFMDNLDPNSTKALIKNKYINLTTFKKDDSPVSTPVWFVYDQVTNKIFMTTSKKAGKLKRLKHRDNVEFAFCTATGKVKGQYFKGSCHELNQNEIDPAHNLLKKKYGLIFKIWATFYLRKHARTYLEMMFYI